MTEAGAGSDMMQEMVREIVSAAAPERIILFGSRGRDEADPRSDVDLMIIVEEDFGPNRSRRREMVRIWKLLSRFAVPKDILLYSRDEAVRLGRSLNHVVARASKEGKVLYERH